MPHQRLSQRSMAIIGLVIAVNIMILMVGIRSGFRIKASPFLGFQEPTRLPGLGEHAPELEHWRLDTDQYILDMGWDFNAPPTTRTYDFVITEGKGWPDGVVRDMLFINGKFPGPLIEANRGDRIVVNVTNLLSSEPTTLHWHGLHLRGQNWYDGTAGVTQCGIPPGRSFVYNFTLNSDQFGTYWYHSHYGAQYLDGVLGPLVVHAPEERPVRATYDQDQVVLLQDWYHDFSKVNLGRYLVPENENSEPIPDNGLINGRNFFNCSLYGPEANRTCYGNTSHTVFTLEPKTKTRLRLINAGAFAQFEFSVDNHPLTVIEADGTLTAPHPVRRLPIHVAQRYSVVLEANRSRSSNYWVRAAMVTLCFTPGWESPVLDATTRAVVSYSARNDTVPEAAASSDWGGEANAVICRDLDDGTLVPLVRRAPPPADRLVKVDFHFAIGAYQMDYAKVNDTTWTPLKNSTTLLQAVDGLHSSSGGGGGGDGSSSSSGSGDKEGVSPWATEGHIIDAFDAGQYVVGVSSRSDAKPEVIDLLVHSLDEGGHPFHLHGHDFWVLKTGEGQFDWVRYYDDIMPSRAPSIADALVRDTLTIQAYSWGLIRFVADNPGLWAFHCHMAWHMEAGLLMQFMSGAGALKEAEVLEDVRSLCDAAG